MLSAGSIVVSKSDKIPALGDLPSNGEDTVNKQDNYRWVEDYKSNVV